MIHTVLGSVPLGDDFLSVLITPHTYSSIELLTSTCRSKDMYTLPMTFYDPFVLLDGHFSEWAMKVDFQVIENLQCELI